VKDEAGVRAETIEEGYDLKAEFASMALEPLGLQNLKIGFFNAFADEPARLRDLILGCLGKIRQSFRTRIQEAITNSRPLLLNHEKEQVQVQEVFYRSTLSSSRRPQQPAIGKAYIDFGTAKILCVEPYLAVL
jgi:hypothetical protein